MTLKQFLKPDWRKIVAFAIIMILCYIFVPNAFFTYIVTNPSCFLTVVGAPDCDIIQEFNVISTLIIVIISYLLSCLIVWIYDKI